MTCKTELSCLGIMTDEFCLSKCVGVYTFVCDPTFFETRFLCIFFSMNRVFLTHAYAECPEIVDRCARACVTHVAAPYGTGLASRAEREMARVHVHVHVNKRTYAASIYEAKRVHEKILHVHVYTS